MWKFRCRNGGDVMVSVVYKENIYPKGVPRETVAEVNYSLSAPDSKEGGELNLPTGNSMSRPWQVMNELRVQPAPVGTLEPEHWTLEGRFMIPVAPDVQDGLEIGFWSKCQSDELGFFDTPLVIERIFDHVQTFNTLGIVFDPASGNCCTEFDVEFYDGFNNLVSREEVVDNQETTYRTQMGGLNIWRVVIKLYRTNRPFRFARIIEIDFGLVITYTDKDISSINLVNEADHDGRSFILPEFNLTILNDGMYNLFDPEGYGPYFLQRQRFDYRHGLVLPDGSTEWVDCGTYHLKRWRVSDSRVEFMATGRTFGLENTVFHESSFVEFPLHQLVRKIYPQAHVAVATPQIMGYFGNIDCRRILAQLAEVSCCLVYEDRRNFVRFTDIIGQNSDTPVDVLDYSNVIGSPEAETNEYYNAISLAEYDMSVEDRQISRTRHSPGQIMVVFSNPTQGELAYELTEGFSLENVIWRTMYMTGTIVREDPLSTVPEAELTIHGQSVTLTRIDNLYPAPWHTGREETQPYRVDLPFFITAAPHYLELREWFLKRKFEVIKKRLGVDIRWRGNPVREVGDFVEMVIDNQGRSQGMHVSRTELMYDGGTLSGRITTVGENPLMGGV